MVAVVVSLRSIDLWAIEVRGMNDVHGAGDNEKTPNIQWTSKMRAATPYYVRNEYFLVY